MFYNILNNNTVITTGRDKGKYRMNKEQGFFLKDVEFDEYVDAKCIKAITECKEYIEKEFSQDYSEEELAVMRERLIFKKAWISAWKLAIECISL